MGAGGRRMMGAEAAVGAMEQAPCSVGVGSEDVLRGILAGGGGVEDGEGRDDWGGRGEDFGLAIAWSDAVLGLVTAWTSIEGSKDPMPWGL